MHTLREKDGVSGYTSRFESEFDPFGAAHGCNSVSAGLGSILSPFLYSIYSEEFLTLFFFFCCFIPFLFYSSKDSQ